ncbi:uncharacterized protein LOC124419091 [Lucilia cuprina]|uniref:uncharacterized protein LOC124419091 n=1 Tax=Lucilia cuprina TaxID=7375 RepID=UPI001F062002|nr:uncharacterized protein LOC124419091 [Lucilia cuprina]
MSLFGIKILILLLPSALCEKTLCINCDSKTDYLCDNLPTWNFNDYRLRFIYCYNGCGILKGQWANHNITTKRRAKFWRGCANQFSGQCTQQFGVCCTCYTNYCNSGINCATEFGLRLEPNNVIFYVMNFIVILKVFTIVNCF